MSGNQGFVAGKSDGYGNGMGFVNPPVEETEGAARKGFLDARDGIGFRPEYDVASKKWQRNYETGRLWIAAMREVGIEPGDWRENGKRPDKMQELLSKQTLDGVVVPLEDQCNPEDPDLEMRVMVPVRTRHGVKDALARNHVPKAQSQAYRLSGPRGRKGSNQVGQQRDARG